MTGAEWCLFKITQDRSDAGNFIVAHGPMAALRRYMEQQRKTASDELDASEVHIVRLASFLDVKNVERSLQ